MVKVRRNWLILALCVSAALLLVWTASRGQQHISDGTQDDTGTAKYLLSVKELNRRGLKNDLSIRWNLTVTSEMARLIDLNDTSSLFHIRQPFSLPVPFATLPIPALLQQQWVKDLKNILSDIPKGQRIDVVASDLKHLDILLNWLIVAETKVHPQLINVIVFSVDKAVCELLTKRNLHCVFAALESFSNEVDAISSLKIDVFTQITVLRITAMRLINHWSYDAAIYDLDAIILKNPDSLFSKYEDSDMVASYGTLPVQLKDKWGATMSGGVFMIRSNPLSEQFWEAVSKVNITSTMTQHSFDDQAQLNYGLDAMRPSWGDPRKHRNVLYHKQTGVTPSSFKVTIASGREICHHYCTLKERLMYYVWHKGEKQNDTREKMGFAAEDGKLWFLKRDWESRTNNSLLLGEKWLQDIATKSLLFN